MSNLGRWTPWYEKLAAGAAPQPYGSSPMYALGAEYLEPCSLVEDWGCGMGWMRNLIPPERYRGIDGTASPFCDEVVDLAEYRSKVPGIFMRGVIEHCYDWEKVLTNAVRSFTERMVLVLFTPLSDSTQEIGFTEELGVPDISFSLDDLEDVFMSTRDGVNWVYRTEKSQTAYGQEWGFFLDKAVSHGTDH